MQKKVVITTDSSSDLPPAIRKEFCVYEIPLHVSLGEAQKGMDCVDIFPNDLYRAYHEQGVYPKTAAPSYGEYETFFRRFIEQGCAVVHISLNSAFSSCFSVAQMVARELDGEIHVVDSLLFCTAAGMLCVQAAKLRDEGLCAGEIARRLASLKGRVKAYFFIDKLDVIAKGGRVPAFVAMGANLLNIHPSVTADGNTGKLGIGKKYRNKTLLAQQAWIEDTMSAMRGLVDSSLVFFMHTPEMPAEIYERHNRLAQSLLPGVERWVLDTVGCMILAHCGFNCLAAIGIEKM